MRDDPLRAEIGDRIRSARNKKGLSQPELSARVGMGGGPIVSNWERGKQMPDAPTVRRLAEVLGVPADELLGIETEEREGGYRTALQSVLRLAAGALGVATSGDEGEAGAAGAPRRGPVDPATPPASPRRGARARARVPQPFAKGEATEHVKDARREGRVEERPAPDKTAGPRTSRTGRSSRTGTDGGS